MLQQIARKLDIFIEDNHSEEPMSESIKRKRVSLRDRIGQRHGSLVITRAERRDCGYLFFCKCDCGRFCSKWSGELAKKHLHCGCRTGAYNPAEFREYREMVTKCTNPKHPKFRYYGGIGTTVCEQWKGDFLKFLDHIGLQPSNDLKLDMIDNTGNYEPGNVRWVTREEAAKNVRKYGRTRVTVHGITLSNSQWSDICGVTDERIRQRLLNGTNEQAILIYPKAREYIFQKTGIKITENDVFIDTFGFANMPVGEVVTVNVVGMSDTQFKYYAYYFAKINNLRCSVRILGGKALVLFSNIEDTTDD